MSPYDTHMIYDLHAWRTKRKLSLRALAALVGRHPVHLARVEEGKMGTSLEVLRRLSKVLKVPQYKLLGRQAPEGGEEQRG